MRAEVRQPLPGPARHSQQPRADAAKDARPFLQDRVGFKQAAP